MASTDVDIANLALARIGVKALIFSLTDGTAESNACNALYAQSRDKCLSDFPWTFATRRGTLVTNAGQIRTGWTYAYDCPADMLVARFIHPGTRVTPYNARVQFAVESGASGVGKVILTDKSSAELVYTAKITDVPSFPPGFVDAVGWLMASELAMALGIAPQIQEMAMQRYRNALMEAGANDLRQGQEDPPLDGEYVLARGGSPQSTPQQQ